METSTWTTSHAYVSETSVPIDYVVTALVFFSFWFALAIWATRSVRNNVVVCRN